MESLKLSRAWPVFDFELLQVNMSEDIAPYINFVFTHKTTTVDPFAHMEKQT